MSDQKQYLPIDNDPEVYAYMWKSEQDAGASFSYGEKIQLGLAAVENADALMQDKMGMTYEECVEQMTEEVANALLFSAINKMVDEQNLTVFCNGRTIKWVKRVCGNNKRSNGMRV